MIRFVAERAADPDPGILVVSEFFEKAQIFDLVRTPRLIQHFWSLGTRGSGSAYFIVGLGSGLLYERIRIRSALGTDPDTVCSRDGSGSGIIDPGNLNLDSQSGNLDLGNLNPDPHPGNLNPDPQPGNLDPGNLYPNLHPDNLDPGNLNPHPGNLNPDPHPGNLNPDPHPGNLNPHPGNLNPHPGNLNPYPGNINPYPGNLNPYPGNLNPIRIRVISIRRRNPDRRKGVTCHL